MKPTLQAMLLVIFIFLGASYSNASEDVREDENGDHHNEYHDEAEFKISIKAEENFGIRKIAITKSESISVPISAVLKSGTESNLYRYRNRFYQRIDFAGVRKSESEITIKSADLMVGDEVVILGIGFLRIAELATFQTEPAGHSH